MSLLGRLIDVNVHLWDQAEISYVSVDGREGFEPHTSESHPASVAKAENEVWRESSRNLVHRVVIIIIMLCRLLFKHAVPYPVCSTAEAVPWLGKNPCSVVKLTYSF